MNAINNGGPAFPTLDYITPDHVASNQDGMTLRDYFAAKAMLPVRGEQCDEYLIARAREAYAFADAMLRAREVQS